MTSSGSIPVWRRVPHDAGRWFDDPARQRSVETKRRLARLALIGSAVTLATAIAVVMARVGPWIDDRMPGPWPLRAVAVLGAFGALLTVVTVPVDITKWRYQRARGHSVEQLRIVLTDEAKGLVVGTVVGSALVLPVVAAIRWTDQWWLLAWLGAMAVILALTFAYPLLILPRWNRLTPLGDDALRRRLLLLAREAGVAVRDTMVMDASRRTTKPQAEVAGLGPTRTIVVSDTMLELPPRQIEFALAHEIAHLRRHDQSLQSLATGASLLLALWFAWLLGQSDAVVEDLAGLDGLGEPGAVPLVLTLLGVALSPAQLAISWLSRGRERRADLDALEFARDPDAGESLYRHIGLSDYSPIEEEGLAYLRSSHPPLAERLELIDRWRRTRDAALVLTDIVDSTATVERLGDRRWYELLRDHCDLVAATAEELGGAVIKDTGDGFLLELPDCGSAVLFAMQLQRALHERQDESDGERIRVRIGVHRGEVIRREGDLRGREVHLAARVAGAAGPGEILVSEAVRAELSDNDRFTFTDGRLEHFKGIEGAQRVYGVEWRLEALGLSDRPTPLATIS